jgi:hypothetical protein
MARNWAVQPHKPESCADEKPDSHGDEEYQCNSIDPSIDALASVML